MKGGVFEIPEVQEVSQTFGGSFEQIEDQLDLKNDVFSETKYQVIITLFKFMFLPIGVSKVSLLYIFKCAFEKCLYLGKVNVSYKFKCVIY